jgi:60 kDa SS-A/Ro ribonucleoprotein
MVSKVIVSSRRPAVARPGMAVPRTDTTNFAGAPAFSFGHKHELAQYAMTGTFGGTYYANSDEDIVKNFDRVLALCDACGDEFVAKLAIYSRQRGFMKDMPSTLVAWLAVKSPLFERIAPAVIDNGRMLRNLVQLLRSGQIEGTKSIPRDARRFIKTWLSARKPWALFRDSVGQDPSIADVIKMVHPKPATDEQKAFWAYLIGKEHSFDALPEIVKNFERFKKGEVSEVPDVEFRLLTALELKPETWKAIAYNAPWHALRMNLNTFQRHGVWEDPSLVKHCAAKLADGEIIKKVKVFPYQLFMAFKMTEGIPMALQNALQDAAEISVQNVPELPGLTVVCPDVSGSMGSAITGRRGAPSKVRCVDVAALISAAVLRKNPDRTAILPFDTRVHAYRANPRDSLMTIAAQLAAFGGGGTYCHLPLEGLIASKQKCDFIWYVSDNESWGSGYYSYSHGQTPLLQVWSRYKNEVDPSTKMLLLDIVPNSTTQTPDSAADTLNVGGWSDTVFEVAALHAKGEYKEWTSFVEAVTLPD